MATHIIRRLGNYERDFAQLDLTKIEPENEESKNAQGLQFLYMQSHKEVLCVGVGELKKWDPIILRAPVLLIPARHQADGEKVKGFMNDPHIDDDSAMHLLADMIIANPERRDVLGDLLRRRVDVPRYPRADANE